MLAASLCGLVAFGPAHQRHQLQRPRTSSALMQLADYDAATYDPEQSGLGGIFDRPEGTHGTGFRFMPVETVTKNSGAALLCIAGAYPGLTAEQLALPQPLPFSPNGAWNYHMLTGNAAPGGFVALPGSHLLEAHPNTVAVVCQSRSLGLEFPDGQEHEVLALIDRGDIATFDADAFDSQRFYAVADPQGVISIRWYESLPAGHTCLGRLVYTQMPFVERPGKSKGWAEGEDEFEF